MVAAAVAAASVVGAQPSRPPPCVVGNPRAGYSPTSVSPVPPAVALPLQRQRTPSRSTLTDKGVRWAPQ